MTKISLKYILLDRAMFEWIKQNAHVTAKQMKLKILPHHLDKSVGSLHPKKITSIENTYELGVNDTLPDILIRKYGNTNYSYIIDGRHRVVVAIRNGYDNILANFIDD